MGGTGCFATTGKVVQTHQNYRFAENRAFSALCPTGIDASVTACTIPARRAERAALASPHTDMTTIAINGFGRIGRLVFRALVEQGLLGTKYKASRNL